MTFRRWTQQFCSREHTENEAPGQGKKYARYMLADAVK